MPSPRSPMTMALAPLSWRQRLVVATVFGWRIVGLRTFEVSGRVGCLVLRSPQRSQVMAVGPSPTTGQHPLRRRPTRRRRAPAPVFAASPPEEGKDDEETRGEPVSSSRGGNTANKDGDDDQQESTTAPREMSDADVAEYINSLELDDLEASDPIPWDELPEMDPLDDGYTPEEEAKIKSGEWCPEWVGELDWDGRADALDAPWRREAEAIVKDAVAGISSSDAPLEVADVHWDYGTLRVTIDRPDDKGVDAEDTSRAARAITADLEEVDPRLRILDRFDLEVSSPGLDASVLSTQRDFDAFKGFDVEVDTGNPISGQGRTLLGRLVEKNQIDLVINQKGRMVRIPYHLVEQVRLPPAKKEKSPSSSSSGKKRR